MPESELVDNLGDFFVPDAQLGFGVELDLEDVPVDKLFRVGFGRDFNFYLKVFDGNAEVVLEKADEVETALELVHIIVSKVKKPCRGQ